MIINLVYFEREKKDLFNRRNKKNIYIDGKV